MFDDEGFISTQPHESDFTSLYLQGMPQAIWCKSVNDTDTPVSAYLKIAGNRTNAFLLESVEGGENLGRYSIIGMQPDVIWRAKNNAVEINRAASSENACFEPDSRPMLESLRAFVAESQVDLPEHIARHLPPMFAGVFGFFGYDVVHEVEDIPLNNDNGLNLPDAIFIRPTIIAVFDNISREITFISVVYPDEKLRPDAAYALAQNRLQVAMASLETDISRSPKFDTAGTDPEFQSNVSESEFKSMVEAAKEYIQAGDIFQVVLSQRFSAPFEADPFLLYRALRRLNPSPFLFYLNFDDCTLVGSSPEILVRVRDGEINIRPIAGTRPRGENAKRDEELEQELLADPKERAEHLMLLDLGRNDVGRSAKLGTVSVTEEFSVERYSHVMHIVSNVSGKLAQNVDTIDALMAGFPAGTVSGAPKIRAMEIISELEVDARGPYGGCIGYFSADGSLDTCIALRTAIIKNDMMYIQSGAGIVADSNAYYENLECHNKARALMKAAAMALSK